MTQRLAGKKVLVTAAGAGIGRAIALACAAQGARVLATDINPALLADLSGMETGRLDVLDGDAVKSLIASAGPFDGLCNVAGFVDHGTILDCEPQVWERAFDLNVTSMYRTIRAVLPGMLASGGGSIVNMASVASSLKGAPNRCVYGATKGAVIGLTKAVAVDFVRQGVRCNAIAPGTVDTPSLGDRMSAAEDPVAARADFIARQPMGRLGTAQEVAALAVYLISDEAAFTTGAVHVIDGGWSA